MVRYCVKCGKKESSKEPLINGYCIDCFLKYRGLLRETPVFEITVCSKCGSWRYHGRWLQPMALEGIIRRYILDTSEHYVNSGVEILEVEEVHGFHRVNKNFYEAVVRVSALLGGSKIISRPIIVRFKITKSICPRCLRKAGKVFNAIVQIRSSRGRLTEDEKQYIRKVLSEPSIADDIVDVEENRNGINIKMVTPVLARRLAALFSREKGAKVIETFKIRKYDPSRGRKEGITTLSIRLPDLERGDIVEYKGSISVIDEVKDSRIKITDLESGESHSVPVSEYWDGKLVKTREYIEEKDYLVIASDPSTIYLMDEVTGEIREYPRLVSLNNVKEGDKMKGYIIRNNLYIVKKKGD